MKNRMGDVRDHLVAAMEALADKDAPMDIDRAKAISDVAQTYINAVKVEVDAYKMAGLNTVPDSLGSAAPLRLVNGQK